MIRHSERGHGLMWVDMAMAIGALVGVPILTMAALIWGAVKIVRRARRGKLPWRQH